MPSSPNTPVLRLAHSPDPDDAFMWWPLFEVDGNPPLLEDPRFRYEPVELDIETLNAHAEMAQYEITAISCAQYPRVSSQYVITACGASLGDAYGPKVVAREPMSVQQLRALSGPIAIPGVRTSAYGALSLLRHPRPVKYDILPFEQIIDRVADGSFEAGVVIHEGQLTFEEAGLHLVVDLGQWWSHETGLPLPLGVNTVRRDLESRHGTGALQHIADMLRRSVVAALENRRQSIEYAMRFGRGLDPDRTDQFVEMYVNAWTLDFGDRGRQAVRTFLGQLRRAGLVPAFNDADLMVGDPSA